MVALPSAEEFKSTLLARYNASSTPRLNREFLLQIVGVFTALCKPQTRAQFDEYLSTCLTSLVNFTRRIPAPCLELPTEPSLFYMRQHLYGLATREIGDTTNFCPGYEEAYDELVAPFKGKESALSFMDWTRIHPSSLFKRPERPNYDDQRDVLRYQEDTKDYQKTTETAYNRVLHSLPYTLTFNNTPLYPYAVRLMPMEIVNLPIDIKESSWFEGTWIVAPQGRGKTNLLRHLILHHLPDACVIIMDPKGDLINSFQRHAPIKDRLALFYPDAQYPLAINPLDIGGHSGEFLEYIFSVLNTEMTTNQSTLLSLVLTLCMLIPKANMETFRDILQNGWKPYEQYVRQLKKRDQDFFDKEWDNPLYKARRPEVLGRLRTLMATPALDEILQSTETKVDLGKMMDDGKVILIDSNYEKLGDKGAEFFGRMFIALVWAAARRRSQRTDKGTPVFFFIDEAHWTIANDTKVSTIIQQCRSQKIAMVFAHQEVNQIENPKVLGALNNCAIKFAKPNAPDETAFLAKSLRTTPGFLDNQTQKTFALYVLDQMKTAISIELDLVATPDGELTNYPRLTDAEFSAVRRRSQWEYCSGAPKPPPDQTAHQDSFYDYEWTITISPRLAKTGGKVREHGYNINIPEGVVHGEVLRLRGAGRPKPDGTYGNAYITLNIPQRADQQTFEIPPNDDADLNSPNVKPDAPSW